MSGGFEWPGPTPFPRPDGWEGSSGLLSGYGFEMYKCDRVAFGLLERPVTMILEAHGDFTPPPSCENGTWDTFSVLLGLWSDDKDLNALLRERYGVPAIDMQVLVEDLADPPGVRWTWNATGHPESSQLNAYRKDVLSGTPHAIRRYGWQTGAAVAYVDFDVTVTTDWGQVLAVHGNLAPPTAWAGIGFAEFAGIGSPLSPAHLDGTFHKFGDNLCRTPA